MPFFSVRPHLLECLKNKKLEHNESGVSDKNRSIPPVKKLELKKELKWPKKENANKKSRSSDDDSLSKLVKRPKRGNKGACRKAQNLVEEGEYFNF